MGDAWHTWAHTFGRHYGGVCIMQSGSTGSHGVTCWLRNLRPRKGVDAPSLQPHLSQPDCRGLAWRQSWPGGRRSGGSCGIRSYHPVLLSPVSLQDAGGFAHFHLDLAELCAPRCEPQQGRPPVMACAWFPPWSTQSSLQLCTAGFCFPWTGPCLPCAAWPASAAWARPTRNLHRPPLACYHKHRIMNSGVPLHRGVERGVQGCVPLGNWDFCAQIMGFQDPSESSQ